MDRESFVAWYDQWADEIYTYLRHSMGPALAEDALQETFLKAWASIGQFQGTNPRAWLFRIAHNVAVDHLRHEDHHRSQQMPTVDGDAGSPDRSDLADALIEEEEVTKIYRALHALPPHYRNVLVLCGVFTLSAHEASMILGWSLPKFYITRHRARKALARVLSD